MTRWPTTDDPLLSGYQADFPQFDLSCLTQKQLDVIVMRYRGGLSWRKIAAFEGVDFSSIRDRHRCAIRKLKSRNIG